MIGPRPWRYAAIDLAAVLAMLAMAAWGFAPIFATGAWVAPTVGGVIAGAGIGVLALRWRWSPLAIAGAIIGAYAVLGGALALRSTTIAGLVPSLDTLRELALGVVESWKALLTVDVPTVGVESVLLVPFIATLVTSVIAVVAGLARRPAVAVLAALVLLGTSVAFGLYRVQAPLVQGALIAVIALAWLAWRRVQRRSSGDDMLAAGDSAQSLSAARRRRSMAAAGMVAAALVVGAGTVAVASPALQRDVLRDEVVPPLELRDYPSPLQSFRRYVSDFDATPLFTVDHLPADARVRLATMDMYDGVVYAVSGDGSSVGGTFHRVGTELPVSSEGVEDSFSVTVNALTGVWVPTVGDLESLSFAAERSDPLNRGLFYNAESGTVVQTATVAQSQTYGFQTVMAPQPTGDDLAEARFATVVASSVSNVPEGVRESAAEAVADASTPYEQAAALAEYLSATGFFSHGLDGQAPSRSGHRAERIAELLGGDQMLGDDEQYAVAYALMAHELGIPARVVMGFYPDTYGSGAFEATGATAHVWVEVAFDGFGWVAFDPAPAEDQAPVDEEQSPEREPKPRVLQPPPPPEPPAEEPPSMPGDDEVVEDSGLDTEAIVRGLFIAAGAAGIGLVIFGPALLVLGAKARRRRRRRKSGEAWDRMSGAWLEVADLAADYRVAVPANATRTEAAALVDDSFDDAGAGVLAARADAGVWAPGEPSPHDVETYWADVRSALRRMDKSRGLTRTWGARLSLRSLARKRTTAASRGRRGRTS